MKKKILIILLIFLILFSFFTISFSYDSVSIYVKKTNTTYILNDFISSFKNIIAIENQRYCIIFY